MSDKKKPIYKRWWFWGLSFFVLILLASGGESPSADSSVSEANTETSEEQFIPGLTAADIKLNLQDQGFACEGPDSGEEYIFYTCKDTQTTHEYIVEFDGVSPTKIMSVQATALNYDTDSTESVVSDFLGYIATTPFEGSSPEEAKQWVQENIGAASETVIAGVTYRIARTDRSAILTIER